ncbi:unnamed protein product [Cylindrotheca closterium]|uniref:Uncharacterized protein n=1 Tax=Cylindrotheca closterium TaxID=2856 RepID=A0AAD2FVJ3_9STRA|nr:unnamed protein product [Cylindrotheca closterium]
MASLLPPITKISTKGILSSAAISSSVQAIPRGGGGTTSVDLSRLSLEFSAMSSYAVVASLLLGSGLYLFAITPLTIPDPGKGPPQDTRLSKWATALFAVMVSVNIAMSLHTVLTFNVMNLYANTALGKGMDDAYIAFWDAPFIRNLRGSAFRAFLVAIRSFKVSFLLSVFLKTNGKHKWVATALAAWLMIWSTFQMEGMIQVAGQTIFKAAKASASM